MRGKVLWRDFRPSIDRFGTDGKFYREVIYGHLDSNIHAGLSGWRCLMARELAGMSRFGVYGVERMLLPAYVGSRLIRHAVVGAGLSAQCE